MAGHVHKMIAKVAQEAAGELYERLMGEQRYYDEWRRRNPGLSPKALETRFISKNWPSCIPIARATLALMLRSPLDNATKESIMEALVLDSTLVRGRTSEQRTIAAIGDSNV